MPKNRHSFYIYGIQPVKESLLAGRRKIHCLFISVGRHGEAIENIKEIAEKLDIPIKIIDRIEIEKLVKHKKHQGVVAKVEPLQEISLDDLIETSKQSSQDPLLVVLDCIEDPRNLGAISRSCLAFGAHCIIIPKDRSADISATAIKASAGALEYLPFIKVTNLARTIEVLKNNGIWIVGTEMKASTTIWDADLRGPLCLVIGGEGKGMRRLIREKCDFTVSIPINAGINSLNASTAASICLYEIIRQRKE